VSERSWGDDDLGMSEKETLSGETNSRSNPMPCSSPVIRVSKKSFVPADARRQKKGFLL
jgi:hypothetical protein